MALILVKHTHRHPLAHDDEVELTVAVVIDPYRPRDHADLRQLRSQLGGHIAIAPRPVLAEQIAAWRGAVGPRDDAPADEQVISGRSDTGPALSEARQRGRVTAQLPMAV